MSSVDSPSEKISAYAWYVAILFAVFFVFSFVDRQIIGILVPGMKEEIGLSDLQLSYIGGLSFVLFYTIFGIPLGRMADSYNRKWLIFAGVVIWTVATAACGLADIFPRKRLTIAISICTMGGAFGFGFAFLGGAWVLGWANDLVADQGYVQVALFGDLTPWRIVFLAVGLPGLFLSLLLFTVREPQRTGQADSHNAVPSIPQVIAYVRTHWRVFLGIYVGVGCLNMGSYAGAFWDITFFDRTYGWPPEESGILYGIAATTGQFVGALIGGLVTDRISAKVGRDAKMLILLTIAFLSLWLRLIYPLMPSHTLALLVSMPTQLLTGATFGVAAAALQLASPARMRGQITAVYFFVQSLISLGLGPTLVTLLTEKAFADLSMIRYSLSIVGTFGLTLATLMFFMARKAYHTALADAEAIDKV